MDRHFHCSFLKEHAPAVPTGLKEYLKYCGVVTESKVKCLPYVIIA